MKRREFLQIALGGSTMVLLEACAPPTQAPAATSKPAGTVAPAASTTQPAAAPAGQAQRGGQLRIGLDVDADSLDPRLTRNTSGFRIREMVFNGLVAIGPD